MPLPGFEPGVRRASQTLDHSAGHLFVLLNNKLVRNVEPTLERKDLKSKTLVNIILQIYTPEVFVCVCECVLNTYI